MTDQPDVTATIIAERRDKAWSFWLVPAGAHTDADRVLLGSGPAGAGVLFPIGIVEQFVERQG